MQPNLVVRPDRKLPHLERLLDPGFVRPRLAPLLGAQGALGIHILKHRPGKSSVLACVFEDGKRAIVKLYRGERAGRLAGVLPEFEKILHGNTRTARQLEYWENQGALVLEWVPGDPVPSFGDLRTQPDLVRRLAVALAEFHDSNVRVGPQVDLAWHLRRTCESGLRTLEKRRPAMARSLRQLGNRLVEQDERLPVCISHGDFSPRQLFVDGSRVYLVDLDGVSQSPPALDVANFRVGLRAHLGDEGEELARLFRDAYLQARVVRVLPGLARYEALGYLRRAVMTYRKQNADWEARLPIYLEWGRQSLRRDLD